jgi:hypothetical protein
MTPILTPTQANDGDRPSDKPLAYGMQSLDVLTVRRSFATAAAPRPPRTGLLRICPQNPLTAYVTNAMLTL